MWRIQPFPVNSEVKMLRGVTGILETTSQTAAKGWKGPSHRHPSPATAEKSATADAKMLWVEPSTSPISSPATSHQLIAHDKDVAHFCMLGQGLTVECFEFNFYKSYLYC